MIKQSESVKKAWISERAKKLEYNKYGKNGKREKSAKFRAHKKCEKTSNFNKNCVKSGGG